MNVFDRINYAMTTLATGGFATHNDSIETFQSPAMEYVSTLFCFLSGLNFILLYRCVIKGEVKNLLNNIEVKFYVGITLIFTFFIMVMLITHNGYDYEHAFRCGIYQVVSFLTTTGLFNDDAAQTGVYSLGCMHPDFDDWQTELSRLARAGVRGIKLHPIYQGVDFDDPRYLRILSRAAELDLFVIIHAGLDVGFPGVVHGSPRMVLRALEEVGPFKLILAHMGGWRCWDEVLNLLPGTGAYIDTSFSLGSMTPNGDGYYKKPEDLALLDEARFIRLIRAFGADRVLFGTDCPWSDQGAEFARFRALPLTKDEQEQILWKNAFALMKGQSESLAV